MKNPYEILGVSKTATDAEIKSAYRKLVMKHHPDKNPNDKSAEEKFKEVNNAYDLLKDPQKKAAYDQFGDAAFGTGNGASAGGAGFGGNPFGGGFSFDMSDMMDEVLRGFGFGGQNEQSERAGRDMLHEVMMSLEEAYTGKTETIKFSSNVKCEKCGGHGTKDGKPAPHCQTCHGRGYVRVRNGFFASERPCPDCNGTGRNIKNKCNECDGIGIINKNRTIDVKIPAGVENGARLRLQGQGEAAMFGGQSGDFYIDIHIRPHPVFQRNGRDLSMNKKVPFTTLALGGEIEVETIAGKSLGVKIPSGTQIGEKLRVRGAGMPGGDLYIEIMTEIPKHLSSKQKKALEEFVKD